MKPQFDTRGGMKVIRVAKGLASYEIISNAYPGTAYRNERCESVPQETWDEWVAEANTLMGYEVPLYADKPA